MKIHQVIQKSEEWHEIRKGKMTASEATAIATNGAGLKTYVYNIISKKHSTQPPKEIKSPDIERGNELEEQARVLYELETGNKVEEVGFIELDEFIGCSPDGLIGEDGGLEIKCPNDANFLRQLFEPIPKKYIWQIQCCLFITKRSWWDYVAYNPNFKNPLFIKRVEPDEVAFKKLEKGLESGKNQIKAIEKGAANYLTK